MVRILAFGSFYDQNKYSDKERRKKLLTYTRFIPNPDIMLI